MTMTEALRGQCLCGGVQYSVDRRDLKLPDACHCGQCRRWSGHVWASVNAPSNALQFEADDTLKWFRASDHAARGFCASCGSSLFWRADATANRIAVALGALETPTGLKLGEHIFVADKGDYYDIADGLPQKAAE